LIAGIAASIRGLQYCPRREIFTLRVSNIPKIATTTAGTLGLSLLKTAQSWWDSMNWRDI
jgi:hypothetical protein